MGVRSKRWWVIGSKRKLQHGFAVIVVVALGAGLVFEDGPRVFARGDKAWTLGLRSGWHGKQGDKVGGVTCVVG